MPLTTATESQMLSSWNWLTDYNRRRNRDAFIQVAKIVYQTLTQHGGGPPNGPHSLEQCLVAALLVLNVFKILCRRKSHANPALYQVFALALTHYILDNEWQTIIQP
jgi:hypothetical protein